MATATPRPFGYYVVKTVRFSGWFLLVMMVLFIVSGYALTGEYGLHRVMGPRTAEVIHLKLDEVLVAGFLVHVAAALYLALRRWGWIKRRRRT